jgi:hypothetical protein
MAGIEHVLLEFIRTVYELIHWAGVALLVAICVWRRGRTLRRASRDPESPVGNAPGRPAVEG